MPRRLDCASRATTWWWSAATRCGSTTVSRGSIVAVAADEWREVGRFLAGESSRASTEILRELTVARMIVGDDLDELEVLERRYRAGTADRSSFALTIVTSLGCNFDCPYCFEAKPAAILDEETERAAARGAGRAAADDRTASTSRGTAGSRCSPRTGSTGCPRRSSSGRPAPASTYSASIVTNGYLLTPDVAGGSAHCRSRAPRSPWTARPRRHDLMRPLQNGRPTFDVDPRQRRGVGADVLPIAIRVNLDASNAGEYERLLDLLVDRGLSRAGHGVPRARSSRTTRAIGAPSETYRPHVLHAPGVRPGRARRSWRGRGTRGLASSRRCRSRSRRRAPRSGSTSSSSARAASSTSAGTPSATIARWSGTSAPGRTRTTACSSGCTTTRSPTRTAAPASRCRPAWAGARTTR